MKIAAIDVGTNSTRLMVAEVSSEGEVRPVITDLKPPVSGRVSRAGGWCRLRWIGLWS